MRSCLAANPSAHLSNGLAATWPWWLCSHTAAGGRLTARLTFLEREFSDQAGPATELIRLRKAVDDARANAEWCREPCDRAWHRHLT